MKKYIFSLLFINLVYSKEQESNLKNFSITLTIANSKNQFIKTNLDENCTFAKSLKDVDKLSRLRLLIPAISQFLKQNRPIQPTRSFWHRMSLSTIQLGTTLGICSAIYNRTLYGASIGILGIMSYKIFTTWAPLPKKYTALTSEFSNLQKIFNYTETTREATEADLKKIRGSHEESYSLTTYVFNEEAYNRLYPASTGEDYRETVAYSPFCQSIPENLYVRLLHITGKKFNFTEPF